jgi:hypothetical protein
VIFFSSNPCVVDVNSFLASRSRRMIFSMKSPIVMPSNMCYLCIGLNLLGADLLLLVTIED